MLYNKCISYPLVRVHCPTTSDITYGDNWGIPGCVYTTSWRKKDRNVETTYLFTAASSPWNFGLCDRSLLDFKIPLTLPCLSAIVVGTQLNVYQLDSFGPRPFNHQGAYSLHYFAWTESVQECSESDECYSVKVHSRCCAGLERERYVCEHEPFDFRLHDVVNTLKSCSSWLFTHTDTYLCVVDWTVL